MSIKNYIMRKVASLIIGCIALFCVGYGITGFATLDTQSMCTEDIDCQYSMCCPLYEQDYGICAAESQCEELYFSSMDDDSIYKAPDVGAEIERNYIAVALGVIMLMILVIVGYFEWKHELGQKKVKKKVKRKSKK